ncbi:hypothetical protein [Streptomyces sp. B27]|uniref:DUF6197 family protein n=1 Tax=Streptomyces sp. B27 TaxID=2485015 RepID=UPI001F0C0A22|nr:hypothetical protein [Streptomyces sp. B27]
MPTITNMPSPSYSVVINAEVLERAAADSSPTLWIGGSGETSTGEAVARHLEAASDLIDTVGWTRTWTPPSHGEIPQAEEGASAEDMLRQLLAYLRDEDEALLSGGQVTAVDALARTAGSEHGDPDTQSIAQGVLDLLVQALTGQPTAYFTPWAARLHRTHAEITLLFTAGAQFARIYGPGAPASVPTSS